MYAPTVQRFNEGPQQGPLASIASSCHSGPLPQEAMSVWTPKHVYLHFNTY